MFLVLNLCYLGFKIGVGRGKVKMTKFNMICLRVYCAIIIGVKDVHVDGTSSMFMKINAITHTHTHTLIRVQQTQ